MSNLLVIGNGFDLSIGARTSYKCFFESQYYEQTRETIFQWIELWDRGERIPPNVNLVQYDFNCWDFLFCLISKGHEKDLERIKWCDIEKVIYDSLINTDISSFSWEIVREILDDNLNNRQYHAGDPIGAQYLRTKTSDRSIRMMVDYLSLQENWRESSVDKTAFYDALLNALKQFELSFGMYIRLTTSSDDYRDRACHQAEKLLDDSVDRWIDSFNYSSFRCNRTKIRHINGDDDAPIFGVNLSLKEEADRPELMRFSKTSRRIHQDTEFDRRNKEWSAMRVENAVVFGHSLNQMDYDYFHYLFTMLQFHTFDLDKMGSIRFVYKLYDTGRSEEIKSRFADSVHELLSCYENNVSSNNSHVLINLLRFSNKLSIDKLDC